MNTELEIESKVIGKTINVLLIEDNPGDANLVNKHLKESKDFNFEITLAKSVKEAVSIINNKSAEFFNVFDVVLLDLGLPDCIGIRTFKEIKARLLGVPIIVLTGSVLERNDLKTCLDTTSGFLLKGYVDSSILKKTILSSIEKQKEHEKIMQLVNHRQKTEVCG